MTESRARAVLRALHVSSDCVRSSALVSFDGLLRACLLAPGVDADRFAAMCASLMSLSARAAKEVDRGDLRQLLLDGEHGPVILTRAGAAGVLAVAAVPTPTLGKVLVDTRSAAGSLAALAEDR